MRNTKSKKAVHDYQKRIAEDLKAEGYLVEEGWSYEICLEILLRMSEPKFQQALEELQTRKHSYTNDYVTALDAVVVARALKLT